MIAICGIDPGLKGGIVFHTDAEHVDYKMPITGKLVDVGLFQSMLIRLNPSVVYIEKQRSNGRQSGQHLIGINYGRLTATIDLCGIRYVEVTPQSWQKKIYGRNVGSAQSKEYSVNFCLKHGYFVPMTSTRSNASPHDGIADAHCIAHYGRICEGIND